MTTVTISISLDLVDLDAWERLRRVLEAIQSTAQPPAPVVAPATLERVQRAVDQAPDDADGPELARRIKAAATPPAPPVVAESPEPAAHGGARPGSGRRPTFTITHQELETLSDRVEKWLTPTEQTAIRLKADGLNYRQIGEQTGTSEKAVYQTIKRCRDKLSRPADYTPPRRRGRRRRSDATAPIVNEGSVHCSLCQANRTRLHVEQHQLDNQRERARQEQARAGISHLSRPEGVGGAA